MAGTDITSLLEAIQKKIDAVDSSASSGDLLRLLSSVRQAGTGSLLSYTSVSQFPNLIDGTTDPQMLGYDIEEGRLYFQQDVWNYKTTPSFQGSNHGYTSGGIGPSGNTDVIDKFPFTSGGNASDVGNLTSTSGQGGAGQSSTANGYANSFQSFSSKIDKISFASDGNATTSGDVGYTADGLCGQSSTANGYASGYGYVNKFPFAADADAVDVANLDGAASGYGAGISSSFDGYVAGGGYNPGITPIDKFPFAADANATDVGDLSVARGFMSGQNSSTHGYTSGGSTSNLNTMTDTIDKFPFVNHGTATDVGNLSVARGYTVAGQSSTTHGHASAGRAMPGYAASNVVDKFSFAGDGNATDVGDLTVARITSSGQQY
tara:strand:+ start:113 stop:1243 length:1131 start_codon:yes stop_codon:yes gene_type:complete